MKLLSKYFLPVLFILLVACQEAPEQQVIGTSQEVSAVDRAAEVRAGLLERNKSAVIVVAHRGDWRNFPENSIAAIESAVAMGVDMVELDVQRTKDSVLILMHDTTLDRTTTGKGKVSEVTYEEIQSLKLRNGAAIRTIHDVPTLEEALLYSKEKVMVNLDKADRFFDQVMELLEKTGTTDLVVMKGSRSLEAVKEQYGDYLDRVIYMPIVNLDRKDAKEQLQLFKQELNPVAFELLYKDDSNPLPKEVVTLLGDESLIWYNTLWDTMAGGHDDDMSLSDPHAGYGYLTDSLGARIIQTDRPENLLRFLRDKDLHD